MAAAQTSEVFSDRFLSLSTGGVLVVVALTIAFLAYRDWQLSKAAPEEQNQMPYSAKFLLIVLGGIVFVWMVDSIFRNTSQGTGFATVAGLILLGVAAVIGIMNVLSVSAARIGIIDGRQPFGLPEGSVRAILTMAFIVLVGVLSAFLLTGNRDRTDFSSQGQVVASQLSQAEANARARELTQVFGATAIVSFAEDSASAADNRTFIVSIHARVDHTISDDIAKQTLTMISTILAAMIGFYFASRGGGDGADPSVIRRTAAQAELSKLVSASAASIQLDNIRDTAAKVNAGADDKQGEAKTKAQSAAKAIDAELAKAQKRWDEINAVLKDPNSAFSVVDEAAANVRALEATLKELEARAALLMSP